MIIAGDLALGIPGMNLAIPEHIANELWFVNLEGSLVNKGREYIRIQGVFNDYEAIRELKSMINLGGVSLANNHIADAEPIESTKDILKQLELKFVGAGNNIQEASQCIEIDGFRILSFGWECIECKIASEKCMGVNPYERSHVINLVKRALRYSSPVICYFHWNYEFELYPQPFDRELAHELIDMGVYAIIGAHAHRVQHYEVYKGRPIVYGLGNFMFSRRLYFNRKLDFGERAKREIAIELNRDGRIAIHHFEYSRDDDSVCYINSDEVCADSKGNAPYSGMTNTEYISFFKANRVQKKLLPVFYYSDSLMTINLKKRIIAMRGWLLNTLVKLGIKSQSR